MILMPQFAHRIHNAAPKQSVWRQKWVSSNVGWHLHITAGKECSLASVFFISMKLLILKCFRNPWAPSRGILCCSWHMGHFKFRFCWLEAQSWTKQSRQNVCRHGRALGSLNSSRQSEHCSKPAEVAMFQSRRSSDLYRGNVAKLRYGSFVT